MGVFTGLLAPGNLNVNRKQLKPQPQRVLRSAREAVIRFLLPLIAPKVSDHKLQMCAESSQSMA